MNADHYFSPTPGVPERRRTVSLELRGHHVELVTAAGTFSPEHLDTGTAVLLGHTPAPPATGTALDLGCGWGPVALALALDAPELEVWAVDVNERAVALTAENASRLGLDRVRAVTPAGVPTDVRFDVIWSNPPIRIGKTALHALLDAWLPRLAPGGEAHLVVAKQLGADSLQRWLGERFPSDTVERTANARGFRVLSVRRGE